jgi:DNA-directed RNA polymerase specialized sigma24 family protein
MHEDDDRATNDAITFGRCRDLRGRVVTLQISSRGKPAIPPFSKFVSEADESSSDTCYEKRKARILQGFDSRKRAIFTLIHEEGCTRAEAAKRLGISRPTLYSDIAEMRNSSPYCWVSVQLGRKSNQHG